MPASVECGRMLVSISLDAFAEANDELEFPGVDEESLTRAVPRAAEGERLISLNAIALGTAFHFL